MHSTGILDLEHWKFTALFWWLPVVFTALFWWFPVGLYREPSKQCCENHRKPSKPCCTALKKATPYSYVFRRGASCNLHKRQFWHFPVDSCLLIYTIRKRRKICITCSENLTTRTHHRSKKSPSFVSHKIFHRNCDKAKDATVVWYSVCVALDFTQHGGKKGRKFEIAWALFFIQCEVDIWIRVTVLCMIERYNLSHLWLSPRIY